MLYGPGDTHGNYGPNRFFRTAQNGSITLFGEGEERRDFVFVDDMAWLVARSALHPTAGVLNVATGRAITFARVATLVADAVPWPVSIGTQARVVPVVHREFDVSALARAFPDFRCASLEEGIARTAGALSRSAV
jgi:nucleoside-diphosphate-sugar epimerase